MSAASSAIAEAMRKLDDKGIAEKQPSLVRQLYTLALLNRQDAMRRLHGAGAADMMLAQQPPSLLALARPAESSAALGFRPSTSAAASSATRRSTSPARRQRAQPSRGRFGAVSRAAGGAVASEPQPQPQLFSLSRIHTLARAPGERRLRPFQRGHLRDPRGS
jgi:hypothetical protein